MDTAMPLARQLREATKQRHDRLEALPFAQRLAAGDLPLTAYTGYLRAMATIFALLEHRLSVSDEPRIAGVWHPDMAKLDAVLADLAYFAADGLDEIPAAADAAQQLANRLLNRSIESPVSLLGYVYVFEGAMLGAQVLPPQVAAAFDLSDEAGLSHLTGYGADTRERCDAAVGADWSARLANTGEVLVAAWLDTRAGIPGVLDNVRDWHSDPARFPPAWVDAVDDCLAATALR